MFGALEFRTKVCGQVCKRQPSLPGEPARAPKLVSALQTALEAGPGPSVLAASSAQMAVLLRGVAVGDRVSLTSVFVEKLVIPFTSGTGWRWWSCCQPSVAGHMGPDTFACRTPLMSQGRTASGKITVLFAEGSLSAGVRGRSPSRSTGAFPLSLPPLSSTLLSRHRY